MSKPQSGAPNPRRDEYILPPIFWSGDEERPRTATRPVYLVHVTTLDKTGERIPVDCTPLEGLPQFPHQLGEKYGPALGALPGSVLPLELVGRDENGALVCKVLHRVRVPGVAAPAHPAAPPAAAPPATGALDAFAIVQGLNERTDKMLLEFVKAREASANQMIDVVSKMAGARIEDAQAAASGAGKAATGRGDVETFLRGVKFAQGLMDAAQGGEADDDEDGVVNTMVKAFVENFAAAQSGPPPRRSPPERRGPEGPAQHVRVADGEEVQ